MRKILVTGSAGLIGSEVCTYFDQRGYKVHGLDNNLRKFFFGDKGDTLWNQTRLQSSLHNYTHHTLDIRDRVGIEDLVNEIKPNYIVHAAAQPSHDKAADIPHIDFFVNAVGTLNLLEACRQYCKDTPFVHMSTNKVYGDKPNDIQRIESELRYDFTFEFANGISEAFSVDQSKHSLFGASKLASDILVQEYGRYFDMPTCCLRGGCLTGPNHSGVELHGFLNYLVKCNLTEKEYVIFGYKGKQVRDNIHSCDVTRFIHEFMQSPKCGEVYNIGGGKDNSCSIREAFKLVEDITGKKMKWKYIDDNRVGDHIVYYSDLTKCKNEFPNWNITKSLVNILEDIAENTKV